ncbi:MAG: TraR/DksA family transcriptional regulator [Myxococcales bacterium]|nr:TraR/DksA family transcriptional regulator [Myxococcales bacterium]MCB9732746.1 TraR/DksA family transcriptional regulator [Deltaproteobacteria bacterium]
MTEALDTTSLVATLKGQLAVLEARLERIQRHQQNASTEPSHDWIERAAERSNDEVVEALAPKTIREIAAVKRALERLDAGDGLLCEGCDEPIDPRRLAILPEATTCAKCAI